MNNYPFYLSVNHGVRGSSVEILPQPNYVYYDINRLRALRFPLAQGVVNELVEVFEVEVEMAWVIVLSAINVVLHGLYDVESPLGVRKACPISLFMLLVAGTGERKSEVIKLVFKVIKDFEKRLLIDYSNRLEIYRCQHLRYKSKKSKLERKLEKLEAKGERTDLIEVSLEKIEEEKPKKPKNPVMLFEKVTSAGIFDAFENGSKNIAVVSAEGNIVKNSAVGKDLSMIAALHSGEGARKKTNHSHVILDDVRVAILLAIQPNYFDDWVKDAKNMLGSGYLPRAFLVKPYSKQGYRTVRTYDKEMSNLKAFEKRIQEFLFENLDTLEEGFQRIVIKMDEQAEGTFLNIAQGIEYRTSAGGDLFYVREHATRIAEQILKIAGNLCKFEGFNTIHEDAIQDVTYLMNVSTCTFKQMFSLVPEVILDAQSLLEWFLRCLRGEGGNRVSIKGSRLLDKALISCLGPNRLRQDERRIENAIHYLRSARFIDVYKERYLDAPKSGKVVIDLAPQNGAHTLPTTPYLHYVLQV